jgi:hypothetical protein
MQLPANLLAHNLAQPSLIRRVDVLVISFDLQRYPSARDPLAFPIIN